ncbi:MAG: hypothetical protein J0I77_11350 [Rudaea sp.]|uniref:hypothetical protein n=1 Tax=unclassified Rudaea TaxID=2627037 RepID=UPI0010F60368|nr:MULTISPECIES: hypothetical protein [unclassified Rudaea]MBN8886306.1 hypothetical protein [Rudaea sp.]MBR0345908.1 hypothetical protein [Rudaea sp.]
MLALAVSVFALALGAWQTRLMQSQARASVWPFLSIGYSYTSNVDPDSFIWQIDNNGVGPARVQSVSLSVDGKPMRHWEEVLVAIDAPPRRNLATTSLNGGVIPPSLNRETTIAAIRVNDREVAAHFKSSIARFRMDICYCSVYDECWVAHWQQSRVDPVERCGADGSVQFDE